MTEDEKKIMMWRNERRSGCMFPTQSAYDNQRQRLTQIKKRVFNGEFTNIKVIAIELMVECDLSESRALAIAIKWWEDAAVR